MFRVRFLYFDHGFPVCPSTGRVLRILVGDWLTILGSDRNIKLTSSRNGVNLGVAGVGDGAPAASPQSANGAVFFDTGTGGGGIPTGSGSRYGTNLELDAAVELPLFPEVTLFDRPLCLIVVPASFFTSGMFSFTRDFRVPRSGQAAASAASASTPDGSTKIWRRELGPDGVVIGREDPEDVSVDLDVVKAGLCDLEGRLSDVDDEASNEVAVDGIAAPLSIRFWNSLYRLCRRSRGDAFRAIPRL